MLDKIHKPLKALMYIAIVNFGDTYGIRINWIFKALTCKGKQPCTIMILFTSSKSNFLSTSWQWVEQLSASLATWHSCISLPTKSHAKFEANCSTLHHPNLDQIILSYFFVSQFTQWVKLPCIGVQKQTSSQNKVSPFGMK